MKPVHQTVFGDGFGGKEPGNCLAACIASILELPIELVPNFMDAERWVFALEDFLAPLGLEPWFVPAERTIIGDGVLCVAVGPGPRGCEHSVVWGKEGLVHDPHPEGGGIEKVNFYILLFATGRGPQEASYVIEVKEVCWGSGPEQ